MKIKKHVKYILLGLLFFVVGMIVMALIMTGVPTNFSGYISQVKGMRQLYQVAQVIDGQFFQETDPEALFEAAAAGMVKATEDEYAAFYTEEEYAKKVEKDSGAYEGIGVTIAYDELGQLMVIQVYEDSPADRAGLRSKDVFVSVNGMDAQGMTADELSTCIAAQEGEFELVYKRDGEKISVMLECEYFTVHRVKYRTVEGVPVIAVSSFNGDCVTGFETALYRAKEEGASGIVIDLRDNHGGNLYDVLDMLDFLVDGKLLVSLKTRVGQVTEYTAEPGAIFSPQIVVLTNGGTASASEIMASALKDNGLATIVGEKTYGKGIVQTIYPVSGGRVKLTNAAYYTPNGVCIHGVGVEPDQYVELEKNGKSYEEMTLQEDSQLARALEVLAK